MVCWKLEIKGFSFGLEFCTGGPFKDMLPLINFSFATDH